VEVHGGADAGRLVITLEDTPESLAADTLGRLNDLPGVVNSILIYHHGGAGTLADGPAEEHLDDHLPA
jgi:nitrate reductase NapD